MERDDRKPSEVTDSYWILSLNEKNNYDTQPGEGGKWLIFEHISKIDNTWTVIRDATRNGQLGSASKVATAKPNPNASDINIKVICVYTADFESKDDVDRIEKNLRKLGIENRLVYKLDKDVGKYQNQGHKNLSQKFSFSKKYYTTLKWLEENQSNKYISFQGLSRKGKKRYLFQRLDISKEDFEQKKRTFDRIGFYLEKQTKNNNEKFFFLE